MHIEPSNSQLVVVFDTTLRDGEQSAGVSFSARDKLEIAERLAAMRVDVIEAGFPAASVAELEAVRGVARQVRDARLRFDLMLVDQTMPRLRGTELARSVAALRPAVPILIYTGYRDAITAGALAEGCIRAVLDKPVDARSLHALLREHLLAAAAAIGRPAGSPARDARQRTGA